MKITVLKQLPQQIAGIPIGSFMWYMGNVAPDGWSVLHGDIAARDDHSLLWDWVQQSGYPVVDEVDWVNNPRAFSRGDGQHTFRFPDFRKEFIRGASDGQPLGSWRDSQNKAHEHDIRGGIGNIPDWFGGSSAGYGMVPTGGTIYGNYISAEGGDEANPRNVGLTPLVYG